MAQVDTLLRAVATKPYFLADDKTAECLEVFSSYFGTSLQCFCFENQASLPSCPNIHRTVQLTHSSCTCTTSTPNGAPCSASDFPNCRNILSNNWQLWLKCHLKSQSPLMEFEENHYRLGAWQKSAHMMGQLCPGKVLLIPVGLWVAARSLWPEEMGGTCSPQPHP